MDINSLFSLEKFEPKSIKQPISWAGHLPFAYWSMNSLKPTIFVELGTHTGNSYFSFCQSVKDFNLNTRCYAVDTWQGDKHAGGYDSVVFDEVNSHNQENYSEFSTLLRTTFDKAAAQFKDCSVNYLHIDGLHTYSAVKHDFETWLPKLAPGAIVIFHDTQVKRGDFGVWKFWGELQKQYPNNIEFLHSHGLGVLQIPGGIDSTQIEWLSPSYSNQKQFIDFISALGNKLIGNFNQLELIDKQQVQISDLLKELESLSDYAKLKSKNIQLQHNLIERDARIRQFELQQMEIFHSFSWRLTRPFREIQRWVQNPQKQFDWYCEKIIYKCDSRIKSAGSEVGVLNTILGGVVKTLARLRPNLEAASIVIKRDPNAAGIDRSLRDVDPLKTYLSKAFNALDDVGKQEILLAMLGEEGFEGQISNEPIVTIVIPVYGQLLFTLCLLASIKKSKTKTAFDILVMDDCSPDNSFEVLGKIKGINVLRNETNQGFLRTCNIAAKIAKGQFIHFLNNDTVVDEGWLDALVKVFDDKPDCGMSGSKLIFADGFLQEAGGLVWNDASGWNYGRNQSPLSSKFNYLKRTDYISGASILVRKSLFEELGFFDERYAPAYCEDTDIAFAIRAAGYEVYYQPESVVVHFEGVSNGTSVESGIKSYQVRNQKLFYEKWKDELLVNHFPPGEKVSLAHGRTGNKKTVLFIDHVVPEFDRDAGSRTMLNIIQTLIDLNYEVKFWPDNLNPSQPYTRQLQSMGVEVIYGGEYVGTFETWLAAESQYISGYFLSRPNIAKKYIDIIKINSPSAPILFYGHDIHHLRLKSEAELGRSDKNELEIQAKNIEGDEKILWSQCDVIYYPSTSEVSYVQNWIEQNGIHNQSTLLPVFRYDSVVDDAWKSLKNRRDLLFVGGFGHKPNADGILWFVNSVLPLVRKQFPDIILHIVGSNAPPSINELNSNTIQVHGHISDQELEKKYNLARVSICPLLYGAGVKGKVVEAMRYGLPVITTPIGAQGLEEYRGALQVGSTAEEMAVKIIELLDDDDVWSNQSKEAAKIVSENYSSDAMKNSLSPYLPK